MSTPVLLVVVAVLTGLVSAATGMAGGVLLLAAFALALPATAVVPMHGAVQLVAGSTRLLVFRRHVEWTFVKRFAYGVLPGSVLGAGLVFALARLDPTWLRLWLGIAIVASVFARPRAASGPSTPRPAVGWTVALGLLCGVVGMLVGSTGPLVSRGLLARGVVKEHHVGTKAVVQTLSQLLKLPLFGLALSFDYGANAGLLVALALATIAGTLLGRRVLKRLSARTFGTVARVVLVAVGLQLALRAAWTLFATA